MRAPTAEFVRSAPSPEHFLRDGRPEIAFVGRSNVGKSSLMNQLLGRRKLARTSSTPGRTRAVNYFLVDGGAYFTDLPGYGFATGGSHVRAEWATLLEAYFDEVAERVLVVQLIDAKVGATALDIQSREWLLALDLPTVFVATKIDKLRRGQRSRALQSIRQSLALSDAAELVPFSSTTGEGTKELWREISAFLAGFREKARLRGESS